MTFETWVDHEGRPQYDHAAVSQWFKEHAGKRVVISMDEVAASGSYNQRKYYFGVVLPAALNTLRESGTITTKDDLHTAFKAMFAPQDGEQNIVGLSKMTAEQQNQYVESVIHYVMSEMGGYVPPPTTEDQ